MVISIYCQQKGGVIADNTDSSCSELFLILAHLSFFREKHILILIHCVTYI
jgi:hypothetical protein